MSEKDITIIAPPGFRAVYDDAGTVTFEAVEEKPGAEALVISWDTAINHAFEKYGTAGKWEDTGVWLGDNVGANLLNNPLHRNFRHRRKVTVTITHPDRKWVEETVEFLVDYMQNYLVDHVSDACS